MPPTLLARLALDAQEAFAAGAAAVPREFEDRGTGPLRSAAWLLIHTAEAHQVWVPAYCGGLARDPAFSPYRSDDWEAPPFPEAALALAGVFSDAAAVLARLDEVALGRPALAPASSRWSGWSVGQMVARALAHLYVHAADLNTLRALAGQTDLGLPGDMRHTREA